MTIERNSLLKGLGEHISKHRKRRGVTIEALSDRSGLSQGNLSEIERGRRDPRYSTLLAIADGLNMSFADLTNVRPDRR